MISSKLNYLYNLVKQGKLDSVGFFDNIDEYLKTKKEFHQYLLELVLKEFPNGVNVVVSGEFGKYFFDFFSSIKKINIIVLPGKIREGNPIGSLVKFNSILNSKNTVFIDDSYCTGGTFIRINSEISKLNNKGIMKIYVLYFDPKPENRHLIPENFEYLYHYYLDFEDKLS